ncbi:MAG: DUF7680 family protein, partial [Anaerolineae bacterium]
RRVAAISPVAFTAGLGLLRYGVREATGTPANGKGEEPRPGPFQPLDAAWGARLACFGLVTAGLRDGRRVLRAAEHLRHASAYEAAWWLGLLMREDGQRALRALRILTEAVE